MELYFCAMQDIIIVGGGLAGLTSSIELAQKGYKVTLIEKKSYPFHRVCGEYVSNEVWSYLLSLGLELNRFGVSKISRFQFSSPSGRVLSADLGLGGFGISRYLFDFELYKLALSAGVRFFLNEQVERITAQEDKMTVSTNMGQVLEAKVVMGAFGKNTKLDRILERDFTRHSSPYLAVKYHIQTGFQRDTIALHNFENGYCGISAIEDNKHCLCYLTTREQLRKHGNIGNMEKNVLWKNPHLKQIFNESTFLYERPEVINEFSFAPKKAVENHVLMLGDAAGLITPLCGNGMAMAIHGGKIAATWIARFLDNEISRTELEKGYASEWNSQFSTRLWVGRNVQRLFGDVWLSELALSFFKTAKPLLRWTIEQTHGKEVK